MSSVVRRPLENPFSDYRSTMKILWCKYLSYAEVKPPLALLLLHFIPGSSLFGAAEHFPIKNQNG